MVNIPSDLRKNKETIIGNMDLRESICLFLGLVFSTLILYYLIVVLDLKNIVLAAFIAGIFLIPFLIMGFKKINGMKMDDYFKVFVSNKILASEKRINKNSIFENEVSNKKYELIRYYELVEKDEMLNLRQSLIDKKILILTEYIEYKNKFIVIFRLDCKDMILEQVKRNKKSIDDKKIKIKNFIKNEILEIKKEKCKSVDKKEKFEFRNNKKIKLKKINDELKELKLKKKYLEGKTFNDLKDEVDIFENLENTKAKRIFIKNRDKKNGEKTHNDIYVLREEISSDEREVYELHLFSKLKFKDFMKSIKDKVVFINNDGLIDLYVFDEIKNTELVDLIKLEKKENLYKGTILSLEGRNLYNNYRKINDLMEIM